MLFQEVVLQIDEGEMPEAAQLLASLASSHPGGLVTIHEAESIDVGEGSQQVVMGNTVEMENEQQVVMLDMKQEEQSEGMVLEEESPNGGNEQL